MNDDLDELLRMMGAGIDRSPYNGRWGASLRIMDGEGRLLTEYGHDTPLEAARALKVQWVAAGRPRPRVYTEGEATRINAQVDQSEADRKRGREMREQNAGTVVVDVVDRGVNGEAATQHPSPVRELPATGSIDGGGVA